MATWADVRRAAMAMPGVEESDQKWSVKGKLLVWERPLRTSDLAHLGDSAPTGEVLGIRVTDEGVKHALCADQPDVFFTTPHFDGYPAVLAVLAKLPAQDLAELVTEAWLDRAPKRAVKEWLAGSAPPPGGRGRPRGPAPA